ncbi:MAG: Ldh family oxidoreductase, partial [Verrucomicrobiales bacterium]
KDNLRAVLDDILDHGNDNCILPGQFEAQARRKSDEAGGLLFTAAEVAEFNEIARELGLQEWDAASLPAV